MEKDHFQKNFTLSDLNNNEKISLKNLMKGKLG